MRSTSSRTRAVRRRALFAALVLCTTTTVVAVDDSVAGADPDLDAVDVALTPVASGLSSPVAMAWRAGDPRLYVAEQTGTVRLVETNGVPVATPVLSLPVSGGGERGLLGLVFSPDGTKLYVDYTGAGGTIHVVEYTMTGDVADPGSARELLAIPHPLSNHNGGQIAIGPEGYLYVAVGDGGGSGDPNANAQNLNTLLGKILRIDPAPSATLPYTIPADNPFVGQPDQRGEIWMYGLRNPWKFTFDRATGDMWIGDVGQGLYEEVDYAAAGQQGTNWGWNLREGFHPFNGGAQPPGGTDPLLEASHADGYCALIGGYLYRGSAIPALTGAYVFGDLCQSNLVGAVRNGSTVGQQQELGVAVSLLSSFGEDPDGELYVASLGGTISKLLPAAAATSTVSIGDKSTLEGDTKTRAMTFPVTLSQPATTTVTVQYVVGGVSATVGTKPALGADVRPRAGTLTFTPNGTGKTPIMKTISVTEFGDTTIEPDETFTVTLSNVTGGFELGRSVGTGTILNDDDGVIGATIGVGDGTIVGQRSGTQRIAFPVTLSQPQAAPVALTWTLTPGSATHSPKATGGGDYGGKVTGTISFSGSATLRSVNVPIWPSLVAEPDESFTVTLSNVTPGVTVLRPTGTLTIVSG
jgi:glucose/arabinose dehydrogenase